MRSSAIHPNHLGQTVFANVSLSSCSCSDPPEPASWVASTLAKITAAKKLLPESAFCLLSVLQPTACVADLISVENNKKNKSPIRNFKRSKKEKARDDSPLRFDPRVISQASYT